MPTHFRDPELRCDGCGATVPRPVGRDYTDGWSRLREAGWRGRSNPDERPLRFAPHTTIWNCPDCPAVPLG